MFLLFKYGALLALVVIWGAMGGLAIYISDKINKGR